MMEKLPESRPPVFGISHRIERDGAGGVKYELFLNLQNQTMAHVTVWAREPRFGMAALEAAGQQLEGAVSRIIKPDMVS